MCFEVYSCLMALFQILNIYQTTLLNMRLIFLFIYYMSCFCSDSFIWYFCVSSEKVQSRVRLLCLLYKTILPWGMARRKLKGWGSLANGFIPLPLISAFCIKKQREEGEEQRSMAQHFGRISSNCEIWQSVLK